MASSLLTYPPLYQLLQKNTKWSWGPSQCKAFEGVKELFTSNKLLVHYDPAKELLLACDASPYGAGGCPLTQGQRREAFASCSLATAEKNYSQLEKEGLAIVFGIKKIPPVSLWSTVYHHF